MARRANPAPVLAASAVAAAALGLLLLLGSWDGLYDALDLPQSLPALSAQLGGAALLGLAYLLWAAASTPELARAASMAGMISLGGGAVVIAAWMIFRDPEADLGIETLGTVILIAVAVVLAALAAGLARMAFAGADRTR